MCLKSLTLRDALHQYLMVDRAEQTHETYRKFLEPFVGAIGPERPVHLIRSEDIDAFVTAMRQRDTKYSTHSRRPEVTAPLAPTTIYKNVKMVKSFFRWCEKQEFTDTSPAGTWSTGSLSGR